MTAIDPVGGIILLIFAAVVAFVVIREFLLDTRELAAIGLHVDFSAKIDELIDDPFTFDADWKKLIPVLIAADTVIAKNMRICQLSSLTERAKRQTYENYDEPEEVGA